MRRHRLAAGSGVADFAARAHAGQKRKGHAEEPYVVHLAEVAQLIAEAGGDATLIAAACLHDVVEHQPITSDALRERFGAEVAALVAEVTDDKSLPKDERKQLQIQHAGDASDGAKRIEIADTTSNLRALLESPPRDWPKMRMVEYQACAGTVGYRCRGVDAVLEQRFDDAVGDLQARNRR